MRVNDYNLPGTSTAGTTRTSETHGADRTKATDYVPRGDGDRVELSGTLRDLSRALSSYGQERSSAVASLTNQYQSGRYEVDVVATSRAIVAEALSGLDNRNAA